MPTTHPLEVTITLAITQAFLRDIATTAVEGGINTWAQTEHYKWRETLGEARHRTKIEAKAAGMEDWEADNAPIQIKELPFPEISIKPANEEDAEDWPLFGETELLLTEKDLLSGIRAILTMKGLVKPWPFQFRLLRAIIDDDPSDLDAEDCDLIIQHAIFGELRYA